MKHTNGPWKVTWPGPVPYIQSPTDGVFVAACFTVREETEANAKLLAAAPDLLNALTSLYALVLGECPSLLQDDHHDEIVTAAIAKATT